MGWIMIISSCHAPQEGAAEQVAENTRINKCWKGVVIYRRAVRGFLRIFENHDHDLSGDTYQKRLAQHGRTWAFAHFVAEAVFENGEFGLVRISWLKVVLNVER